MPLRDAQVMEPKHICPQADRNVLNGVCMWAMHIKQFLNFKVSTGKDYVNRKGNSWKSDCYSDMDYFTEMYILSNWQYKPSWVLKIILWDTTIAWNFSCLGILSCLYVKLAHANPNTFYICTKTPLWFAEDYMRSDMVYFLHGHCTGCCDQSVYWKCVWICSLSTYDIWRLLKTQNECWIWVKALFFLV